MTVSYLSAWEALRTAAHNANGYVLAGNTEVVDRLGTSYVAPLSNGEAVAVIVAWQRAIGRSSTVKWPDAYGYTILALGWRKPGDKFIMSQEHARAPFPYSGALWAATKAVAARLDDDATVKRELYIGPSMATYEAAARGAWVEMKARGDDKVDPDPAPCIPIPLTPICLPTRKPKLPELPAPPAKKGGGWVWLVVVGAIVLSQRSD